MGLKVLPVAMDEHGIIPASVRQHLSPWRPEDGQSAESDIPKLLYCVPHCQNPTGATLTLDRKQEIYQVIAGLYIMLSFWGLDMGSVSEQV